MSKVVGWVLPPQYGQPSSDDGSEKKSESDCSCELSVLMNRGCLCGAMDKEKKKKCKCGPDCKDCEGDKDCDQCSSEEDDCDSGGCGGCGGGCKK